MSKNSPYLIPWPPHKKKIYFPFRSSKSLANNPVYHPFSLSGKLIWNLWAYVLKYVIRVKKTDFIDHHRLDLFKDRDREMIIIKGEKGDDPNYTAIDVDEQLNPIKITKIAFQGIGRSYTENEIDTLKLIQTQPFAPNLLSFSKEDQYAYFTTDAVSGNNPNTNALNEEIIEFLCSLRSILSTHKQKYEIRNLEHGFSHGDFCPWNIKFVPSIYVYDWEMSGIYPLGYDLFMYLFQFEILVNGSQKSSQEILKDESEWISKYFTYFEVADYNPYFIAFLKLRIQLTSGKLKQSYQHYLNEQS